MAERWWMTSISWQCGMTREREREVYNYISREERGRELNTRKGNEEEAKSKSERGFAGEGEKLVLDGRCLRTAIASVRYISGRQGVVGPTCGFGALAYRFRVSATARQLRFCLRIWIT